MGGNKWRLWALVERLDADERRLLSRVRRVELELKVAFWVAIVVMWMAIAAALTPTHGESHAELVKQEGVR